MSLFRSHHSCSGGRGVLSMLPLKMDNGQKGGAHIPSSISRISRDFVARSMDNSKMCFFFVWPSMMSWVLHLACILLLLPFGIEVDGIVDFLDVVVLPLDVGLEINLLDLVIKLLPCPRQGRVHEPTLLSWLLLRQGDLCRQQ